MHPAVSVFCYVSLMNNSLDHPTLIWSSVFHDLIVDDYLTPELKALCLETPVGDDVFALKVIGVTNSVDFIFSGPRAIDKLKKPSDFAAKVARTLKPEWFLVVHTSSNASYSFNSFIDLVNGCWFIRSRNINKFDSTSVPYIREIVMKRVEFFKSTGELLNK